MRRTVRWALALLVALLALAPAAPAFAASPTLTPLPSKPMPGQSVTLVYDGHTDPQTCPAAQNHDDTVRFKLKGSTFATADFSPNTCKATTSYPVPKSAKCGSTLAFSAVPFWTVQSYEDSSYSAATNVTVTCPKPTASPTISLLPSFAPSPTRTPSPTPSPTASATPSATPSAIPTPSATPTPTFASSSPQAVVAVQPPHLPGPSGGSKTPWYVGGIALGLLGVAGSLLLVRPRTSTPVWACVAVASVAAGSGLLLLAPSDPPTPVVLGSYAIGDGEGCAAGDVPLAGGFYSLDTPSGLLRFQPRGSSSETGYWESSVSGTGQASTVCLRLGRPVVWRVRSRSLPATAPSGAVSCQVSESLLGGGFAFPWGLATLSSYPQAPMRWVAANGPYTDGPAPEGEVSALCAELPEGIRTYVTTASSTGGETVRASCFKGDHPLGGGFAGPDVVGSYPTAEGWSVQPSAKPASAYALCFHPSRALGLKTTYVAEGAGGDAACGSGDVLLGGGWQSGTALDGLQHFEPNGKGWKVTQPSSAPSTAYALCAKRW